MSKHLVVGVFAFALLAGQSAQAIEIAVTDFGPNIINNSSGTDRMLGWIFTAEQDIVLTHVGIWDGQQDGLLAAHDVGVWDSGGALLGSQTVQAGTASAPMGDVIGGGVFRYELITPINLFAGQDYVIAGQYSFNDVFESEATFVTTSPAITFVDERFSNSLSGFVFPTNTAGRDGLFGVNFKYDLVPEIPEPATAALGLMAMGALGLISRRRAA